jgi:hypothetical protein
MRSVRRLAAPAKSDRKKRVVSEAHVRFDSNDSHPAERADHGRPQGDNGWNARQGVHVVAVVRAFTYAAEAFSLNRKHPR